MTEETETTEMKNKMRRNNGVRDFIDGALDGLKFGAVLVCVVLAYQVRDLDTEKDAMKRDIEQLKQAINNTGK